MGTSLSGSLLVFLTTPLPPVSIHKIAYIFLLVIFLNTLEGTFFPPSHHTPLQNHYDYVL